jgi:Tol biopolymer transport system component
MSRPMLEVWGLAVILGSTGWAQVTERVSVNSSGAQGNGNSGSYGGRSISADGRYVAFSSLATILVPGDTNGTWDVFVRDRQRGTTERVSVDSSGAQGNSYSGFNFGFYDLSISADGRFVAFDSYATNLVPGDTNGFIDVFVRDRQSGTTERVSVATGGTQGNNYSCAPLISADGRYIAFTSYAFDLVPGDTNGFADVFVRDRQSGTTQRVSVDSGGAQGNRDSGGTSISADGRYVAFSSEASNLVSGDTNGFFDVFVRDRQNATTERVSVDSGGAQGNGNSARASISADGRYVAFKSIATNLVPGDTNALDDVFVRDRQSGTTERVSVDSGGAQGNANSEDYCSPSISADGRYVAFGSYATNLVPGDTNGFTDVFVRDRQSATTERVSVNSGGAQGNSYSLSPSISADGRYVAFDSSATNLVPGDTNGLYDVFVRDRNTAGFASLCDPGVGGVIACPCSNPPSGPDRGCDNSASTGGAILSASGVASVSADSLVLTTSGEKPTALSIVVQGSAVVSSGLVYGQGVRCPGGTLKRLYVKLAHGGSITAPDFFVGDLYITERSAALGDPIQPGQSRWYLVYYRDPVVLGGCPSTSLFNATQTGQVSWSL